MNPPLKSALVIFLHGLGDSGAGWRFLPDYYKGRSVLDYVRWVLPSAPSIQVTLNGGIRMPGWYDIVSLTDSMLPEDESGMLKTVAYIHSLIDQQIDKGFPPQRIVLGGFSQGGAMALLAGMTYQKTLAGIISLSGYLPLRNSVLQMRTESSKSTPVFMAHGTADPIVNFQWGKASMEVVRDSLGMSVEWHQYSGLQHSANEAEFDDISSFLQRVVPK